MKLRYSEVHTRLYARNPSKVFRVKRLGWSSLCLVAGVSAADYLIYFLLIVDFMLRLVSAVGQKAVSALRNERQKVVSN